MQAKVFWSSPIQFRNNPLLVEVEAFETKTEGIILHRDLLINLDEIKPKRDEWGNEIKGSGGIPKNPVMGDKWTLTHAKSGIALISAIKDKQKALTLAEKMGAFADYTQEKEKLLQTPGLLNNFFAARDEVLE